MTSTEDFLKHYGVLGMHWGQRKQKEQKPQLTPQQEKAKKKKQQEKVGQAIYGSFVGAYALSVVVRNPAVRLAARKGRQFALRHLSDIAAKKASPSAYHHLVFENKARVSPRKYAAAQAYFAKAAKGQKRVQLQLTTSLPIPNKKTDIPLRRKPSGTFAVK